MTLNPLAFPKGVKFECELCHQPAYFQCTHCNVTYYCCKEHQAADWEAVHETICQRLIALRKKVPFILSKYEHMKRDADILAERIAMIEFTRIRARKFLHQRKETLAVPAAMQSLRFATIVYGVDSIELVPSFLLLGEASIGLGKLVEAAEYFAQVSWRMLKTAQPSAAVKSRLHRSLGLLELAKGQFAEALRNFAEDVYQATVEWGPDDVHTCGGYFYMADAFLRQNKRAVADSLYRQVTETWFTHLKRIFDYRTRPPPILPGVGPRVLDEAVPEVPGLDEVQESEAETMLTAIYMFRRRQACCLPQDKLLVCLTLGILHFLMNDIQRAKDFGKKAFGVSRHKPDHEYSKCAIHCLRIFEHAK